MGVKTAVNESDRDAASGEASRRFDAFGDGEKLRSSHGWEGCAGRRG